MPLGPRLDRPSAVGDEGRPRATSLGVATTVVLAVVVAAGLALGDPAFFTGFALLVGLTVAGMALAERDRVRERVVGHLLFLPGASLLLVVVFVAREPVLLVLGTAAALAGAGGAWADVGDGDSVRGLLRTGLISYVFGFVWLVIGSVGLAFAFAFWSVATGLSGGARPGWALAGLAFVVSVVAVCLGLALRAAPVVALAPADREAVLRHRVRTYSRRLVYVAVGAFALTWLFAVLGVSRALPPATDGSLGLVLSGLTSRVVVVPLVLVGALALGAALLATLGRKATTEYDASTSGTVVAALAGAGYVAMLALLVLSAGLLQRAAVVVAFGAVSLPLVVFFALVLAVVAVYVGALPEGATPLALAAAGLVTVAVGAVRLDPPSILVFGATAGALVVWDVGTYGFGVTAELGHLPDTRRLELYHSVFAVGVGVAAVAGATALSALVGPVESAVGTPAAMALAAAGVLLLLVSLRG
jgi:hypothetical protein